MSKNESALIEKFKKLESELVETLKVEDISFAEDAKKQVVKSQLKLYIKKVEKARKLFEEYERVALEIEKIAHADAGEQISSEVVNLREENNSVEKEVYVKEILAEADGVKVVQKKKKKTSSTKEF